VEPEQNTLAVAFAGGRSGQPGGVVPAGGDAASTFDNRVTVTSFEEGLPADPAAKRPRVGVQLKKWLPRDEFDPEIFNRRSADQAEEKPAAAVDGN
jgi:hypothetical protein